MKRPIYPHQPTCQSYKDSWPCDCGHEADGLQADEWIEYLYATYANEWNIKGPTYKRESNYISSQDAGPCLPYGKGGWYLGVWRNGRNYTITGYSIIGCVQEALQFLEQKKL